MVAGRRSALTPQPSLRPKRFLCTPPVAKRCSPHVSFASCHTPPLTFFEGVKESSGPLRLAIPSFWDCPYGGEGDAVGSAEAE